MKPEKIKLECPFCHKSDLDAIHFPSVIQSATSAAAHQKVTKFYKTKEKYEVQSKCPNCGKSVKEIQKALDEGVKDPEKEKKKLKELKDLGLPTVIETKF